MLSLSKVNMEAVEKMYGKNSMSHIVDGLLEEFVKAHIHTPQDYMKAGAESLKELVEERLI